MLFTFFSWKLDTEKEYPVTEVKETSTKMSNTCVQQPVQEKKGFGYSKLKSAKNDSTKGFTIQSYQKDVKVCSKFLFLSLIFTL